MTDMNQLAIKIYRIPGLLLVLMTISFLNLYGQPLANDFEKMQGSRFSYTIDDPADSLSSKEFIELRDENGLPRWFGRYFHKVVCLTGECKMVHLWLYWDGAGNYLGFVKDEKEPLTKTDHHDFSEEDYRKLHNILADSVSVLKSLKQEDLIILPEKKEPQLKVDAISGATRQYLQDYLVRNAAYTCYTLWHTVYGPTRAKILGQLDSRINVGFLGKIFELNDPVLQIWAIQSIAKNPEYAASFAPNILKLVQSGNDDLAHVALNYFTTAKLADPALQQQMAKSVGAALAQIRFEIIWKLKSLPHISNESIVVLLDDYLHQKIYAGLLGYIFEMVHSENLKDPAILQRVKKLSKDQNQYVRNLAAQFLSDAKK
jgi:hypothetical protein